MTDPVQLVAGVHAQALTELLGVPVEPSDIVAITPQSVDSQWYADNAVITADNEAMWWSLSRPERIIQTRSEIKAAVRELTDMSTAARKRIALERHKVVNGRDRTPLLDTIPDLIATVDGCKVLIAALRRNLVELETIYARLLYKYQRPPAPRRDT